MPFYTKLIQFVLIFQLVKYFKPQLEDMYARIDQKVRICEEIDRSIDSIPKHKMQGTGAKNAHIGTYCTVYTLNV